MIYVPDLENFKCFVIESGDVIRAYKDVPDFNVNVSYRDYFINSHYIFKDGSQFFNSSEIESLPSCINNVNLTNAISYRHDFTEILICFTIIIGIFYFIISKIIRSLFFGGRYA